MYQYTVTIVAVTFISLSCIALLSFSATGSGCDSVKNGTFHFYADKGQYHTIIIRKDSMQTEINTGTGDTSYWRVSWISDCTFAVAYVSGTNAKTQQELDFYKQSALKFAIVNTSKHYYTYNALFTYNNSSKQFSDTMWLQEKK